MSRPVRHSDLGESSLAPGSQVRVRLVKAIHPKSEYDAVEIGDDGVHIVVRSPWAEEEARDFGFVRFEPGDVFTEHYWRDRWYSIKRTSSGSARHFTRPSPPSVGRRFSIGAPIRGRSAIASPGVSCR